MRQKLLNPLDKNRISHTSSYMSANLERRRRTHRMSTMRGTYSVASVIRIIDHYTLHILVSYCLRNSIRREREKKERRNLARRERRRTLAKLKCKLFNFGMNWSTDGGDDNDDREQTKNDERERMDEEKGVLCEMASLLNAEAADWGYCRVVGTLRSA